MTATSQHERSAHWLSNWRDWVLPVGLSVAAVVVVLVAFAGWRPFGPPSPKECGQVPDTAACVRENEQVRLDQRGKDTDTAVKIGTGLFAFAAGYVALRGHLLKRGEHELALDRALTERYTKAIDQLGTEDKPDVVLGGIYALERVALDSPDRDLPTVEQVLTAYIRRKAGRVWLQDVQAWADEFADDIEPASAAVGAALTVIGRVHRQTFDSPPSALDLGRVAIPGVRLNGADLAWSDLAFSLLAGADLRSANLANADLRSANLANADLRSANLANANLTEANLSRANLRSADLTGANLNRADLTGANLSRANLPGANLSRANLPGANLPGANLSSANLRSADLTEANLSRANLTGADLTEANVADADLTGADLAGSRWNSTTTWPTGFSPPPSRRHGGRPISDRRPDSPHQE